MKQSKFLTILVLALSAASLHVAEAASFGRSSGSSAPSYSRGASSAIKPTVIPSGAQSPQKVGGIGGTSGSMGVRKSDVTTQVATRNQQQRDVSSGYTTNGAYGYQRSAPSYSQPSYNVPQSAPSNGSTFMSSFGGSLGGSLIGSMLGNALSSNHPTPSTTVINNGTPASSTVASSASIPSGAQQMGINQTPAVIVQESRYGMLDFLKDVIIFSILIAIIVGIALLFYKGFKMLKNYFNRERGIVQSHPVSPTGKFWEIQRAFTTADIATLKAVLGPDMVDEATQNLEPTVLSITNVSHEVVLNNPREFSVHYKFSDDGQQIEQVWHFELHDGQWKLNGLENI